MNGIKSVLFLVSVLMVFTCVSCSDTVPKPRGYFRIDLEPQVYDTYSHEKFPCQFQYPSNVAEIKLKGVERDSAWLDIFYPRYNARIYCTYRTLHNNFQQLSEDSRRLVYKPHTVKADAINERVYQNEEHKVYGVMYELKGNTASNIQFVMSDSVHHFFRGALYFNAAPNKDSIAPVVDYIQKDIIQLIESLEWKQ